ncbi:MAG: hypothetical protein AAF411_11465 [Myxococcota bacterium]
MSSLRPSMSLQGLGTALDVLGGIGDYRALTLMGDSRPALLCPPAAGLAAGAQERFDVG